MTTGPRRGWSKRTPRMPECSNESNHTESPTGYLHWHEWAAVKVTTHVAVMCQACRRYAIWQRLTPNSSRCSMPLLDADFVPCSCPAESYKQHEIPVRGAEYIDGRGPKHRGTRILRTLCCELTFALIPLGHTKPNGFVEVKSVRLANGALVRRIAVQPNKETTT